MAQLIAFIMTSLDGFYEGPGERELDWHNVDAEFNEFAVAQLDEAGTLVFGRRTYDLMAEFWPSDEAIANDPQVASRMNAMDKIVCSSTMSRADWSGTTLVSGDAVEAIAELKSSAERDLLVLGSQELTGSFATAGVLDELRVMVNPVTLGRGKSLFMHTMVRVPLQLVGNRRFSSGNVLLTYRPAP